jgi:hypothetical protein
MASHHPGLNVQAGPHAPLPAAHLQQAERPRLACRLTGLLGQRADVGVLDGAEEILNLLEVVLGLDQGLLHARHEQVVVEGKLLRRGPPPVLAGAAGERAGRGVDAAAEIHDPVPLLRPLAPRGVGMQAAVAVKRRVELAHVHEGIEAHRDLAFDVLGIAAALPREAEVQHERAGRVIGFFSRECRKHPFP